MSYQPPQQPYNQGGPAGSPQQPFNQGAPAGSPYPPNPGASYPSGLPGYGAQTFGAAATFGQRALARLIDSAILLIAVIPYIIGLVMLASSQPRTVSVSREVVDQGNPAVAMIGAVLMALSGVVMLGLWLWNRVFKMGNTGQSVGKKVMGLKLVKELDGQPVGAGMSFLRDVVDSLINNLVYLSWLWMLWDERKQTLADKAVKSVVIQLPK